MKFIEYVPESVAGMTCFGKHAELNSRFLESGPKCRYAAVAGGEVKCLAREVLVLYETLVGGIKDPYEEVLVGGSDGGKVMTRVDYVLDKAKFLREIRGRMGPDEAHECVNGYTNAIAARALDEAITGLEFMRSSQGKVRFRRLTKKEE